VSKENEIFIASPIDFHNVPLVSLVTSLPQKFEGKTYKAHNSISVKDLHSCSLIHLSTSNTNNDKVYSISSLLILLVLPVPPEFWYNPCRKFIRAIAELARSEVGE
jgi:hypothetical protein